MPSRDEFAGGEGRGDGLPVDPPSADQDADLREQLDVLATMRTKLSAERSLLGWMRTAASLYAFGFTLAKFFDYLQAGSEGTEVWNGPHRLGLVLVILGMLVLIVAVFQLRTRTRRMKELGLPIVSPFSLPMTAAAVFIALGVTTLLETWPG